VRLRLRSGTQSEKNTGCTAEGFSADSSTAAWSCIPKINEKSAEIAGFGRVCRQLKGCHADPTRINQIAPLYPMCIRYRLVTFPFRKMFLRTPDEAAAGVVFCLVSSELPALDGHLISDGRAIVMHRPCPATRTHTSCCCHTSHPPELTFALCCCLLDPDTNLQCRTGVDLA